MYYKGICIVVFTTLKMATEIAETCWWPLYNKIICTTTKGI